MSKDISVYITSYNQREYLKEAIESVIAQTLKPYEIIIADDASTDGSIELIESYVYNYPGWIKGIFNKANEGIAVNRTKAVKAASGQYISWVDGDDCFLSTKLEKEYALLENGKYQIAFSNYYIAEEHLNNYKGIWSCNLNELPTAGNMFKEILTRTFPRGTLYRSELIELNWLKGTDLYDANLKIYEDYDLRIRLGLHGQINYTIEPLSVYRLHGRGISRASSELHYESFKYIFTKYSEIVDTLPEAERHLVKSKLSTLLDIKKSNRSKKHSAKDIVKRKLISLINRL